MKYLSVLVLAASVTLSAQGPAPTLPGAYKIQFENQRVKVTRVHYAPLAKLPPHAHTPWPAAYVYLNDGGPVVFRHIGGHSGDSASNEADPTGFRGKFFRDQALSNDSERKEFENAEVTISRVAVTRGMPLSVSSEAA